MRDVYRKETSNMQKELMKDNMKKKGIELPPKSIIDTRIGKEEKEYNKLSEALNKTVKSLNLAEKKWADAGRQPSGTLYNSYKAVLKEVKKNKEDADINQPKILEIEKDKLKDLWK